MTPPTPDDRTLAAFRALTRAEDPLRTYQGLHEYAVQRADASTFDGLPTDPSFSPQLPTQVPYRPALAGSSCVPVVGTRAYVAFANSDPSKPIFVAFDQTLPDLATVDANATGIVKVGPTALLTELGGTGATALALAAQTAANFTALLSAITNAIIVPSDGGASLKATILSALALAGFPVALATTKVTGK
jgi:hypothetical protein